MENLTCFLIFCQWSDLNFWFMISVIIKNFYSSFEIKIQSTWLILINHSTIVQILCRKTLNLDIQLNASVSRYCSQNVWFSLSRGGGWWFSLNLLTTCCNFREDIAWPRQCLVTWPGCWWAWLMGRWLSS